MKDIIIDLPDSLKYEQSPQTSTYYLKGATYTPSVDSAGNLSWTNDKNLPNPPTVNIKGPSGSDYDDTPLRNLVGAVPKPNLADNWYFLNPVNQRNVTGTISTTGYFLDRWILDDGSVTITDDGIVLNGSISQKFEESYGDNIVTSVLYADGTIDTAIYNSDVNTLIVSAENKTIVAVKLEIGSTQTLASNIDGTWVLNEIPNYEEQLSRCQRYFAVIPKNRVLMGFLSSNATLYRMSTNLSVPMRTQPIVIQVARITVRTNGTYSKRFEDGGSPDTVEVFLRENNSYIRIDYRLNKSVDGTINNHCISCELTTDLLLSADL